MFQIDSSLVILIALTLAISLLYFYIFKKSHEKYISFWGFSWTMYAISLVFSIFLLKYPGMKLLIASKQICDLFNSLFLLAGTYVFVDKRMPYYWIQFTIINLIWIGMATYYDLSFITITLLASIFFNIIALVTGIMLLRYWKMNVVERVIIGTIFFVWGLHKAYYPYLYPALWNSPIGYMSEIILANILNFCILIIYLMKIRQQLAESEKRFRLMAENAQDLIYLYRLSPSSCFEYVSPSSLTITGYTPEEFYEDPSFFDKLTHPDDLQLLNILKESKMTQSEPVILRWMHKDGHYVWTEHHTTVISDELGNISAIEGIIRDITDRKRVEENMILAERSRRSLLTNISHELRSPITSILGYTTAIVDGTILPVDDKRSYIKLIHTKTLRLQHLVQDLFQLTQLESGQTSFNFSQLSIRELIHEIIHKYELDVHHAGMKFELRLSQVEEFSAAQVIIDVERIDQVFSNLIFNAIKYTPLGGTISIELEKLTRNDVQVFLFKILDSGMGISENDLSHIFERFYKGRNANHIKHRGSGLGLTISKEIIEFHKGEIWADSSPGNGSTFYFTLPEYL
jgi:two-component system, sporulation sensor kinase C